MSQYDRREFQHDGKDYEVRIASDGHTVHVRVFRDGKPANGYSYSVELEICTDALTQGFPFDPVADLMQMAEGDVRSGKWQQYVAAVKAFEDGQR